MIRFRQKATGAEAEWDQRRWSGDSDFVRFLESAARLVDPPGLTMPNRTFAETQRILAEGLPQFGVVVLRQTKPVEHPHNPDLVQ